MKQFFIFTLLIVFGMKAGAQVDSRSLNVVGEPRFYLDSNGYHLDFNDGREISFYEFTRPAQALKLSLKQIENTCIPDQELSECAFFLDFAPYHIVSLWTKHTDPREIGKAPQKDGLNTSISNTTNYYQSFKFPSLVPQFKPDRLECSNYDWTQGMKKNTDGHLIVDSMASEVMLENTETNVNENLSFGSVFNVLLGQGLHGLEIRSIKSSMVRFQSGIAPYVSSQILNINYVNVKNETCQIAFESSVGRAGEVLRSPYFTEIDYKNLRPMKSLNPAFYIELRGLVSNLRSTFKQGAM